MKIQLFLGLAIQPSINYSVQGTPNQDIANGGSSTGEGGEAGEGGEGGGESASGDGQFNIAKTGYIQVPVQLQWGLTIGGIARAYAFAEPFVGYMVDEKTFNFDEETPEEKDWDFQNRLNYGVGAGLGVEIMKHIQLSARYVWNMGSLLDENGQVTASLTADNCIVDRKKVTGWVPGSAKATVGEVTVSGHGIYFSFKEEFVKITADAEIKVKSVHVDFGRLL